MHLSILHLLFILQILSIPEGHLNCKAAAAIINYNIVELLIFDMDISKKYTQDK
jgi:hypothetical protein